jgi:hypothetical protein
MDSCGSFKAATSRAKDNARKYDVPFEIRKEGNAWLVEGWVKEEEASFDDYYIPTQQEEDDLWDMQSSPDPRWSEDEGLCVDSPYDDYGD